MAVHNTDQSFGWVTKTFHWLTAFLVVAAIVLGVMAQQAGFDTSHALARKAWLFSCHKTIGLMAFFVAVFRILWALTQPRPGLLNADKKLESFVAELVHWLLYGSMVLVPIMGWVSHAASEGFAPIWWPFGQNLIFIPKSVWVMETAGALHGFWEKILLVSIGLHIAGAIKHHVVDKDDTLRRMTFGTCGQTASPHHSRLLPPTLAAVIFMTVMGATVLQHLKRDLANLGNAVTYDQETPLTVHLPAQNNQQLWTVDQGGLSISITQFGSEISGGFEIWSAHIAFDETATTGTVGQVDVTVDIGSLILGSVSEQAMETDYFDQSTFPKAVFAGPIIRQGDAYFVDGILNLKGIETPLKLPFDLILENGLVEANGQATVARLAHGIGVNQPDGGTLGLDVTVDFGLIARKSE